MIFKIKYFENIDKEMEEKKKDPKMVQHYTLEYQEIYHDFNYTPIITLLGLLFLILYFIAIYKGYN